MKTLASKLMLAFVAVGLVGALLIAVLLVVQTRNEMSRLSVANREPKLTDALSAFYKAQGSWDGLPALDVLHANRNVKGGLNFNTYSYVVVDELGRVVVTDGSTFKEGEKVPWLERQRGTPLEVDGTEVGRLLLVSVNRQSLMRPPELAAFQRTSRTILISGAVATGVAILLGIVLSRTLTRPIRELTAATRSLAEGDLGRAVPVRSRDELGELATAFNRMSADLAHAQEQRRQMTADIAHDLRTPLTVILGYTEALRDGKIPPDADVLEIIHDEAKHLDRLIRDLRTLSLADAHELTLHCDWIDPAILLERAAAAYATPAAEKGIVIQLGELSASPVYVDEDRIMRVLHNLMNNALKHTGVGGMITLSAISTHSNQAKTTAPITRLTIADTGIGIEPDDLPHIFDRFYRADESRLQNEQGSSGLGLAIAKSLVEAHDGCIKVESIKGKGASFAIDLPLRKN